jgi:hypothetical protein
MICFSHILGRLVERGLEAAGDPGSGDAEDGGTLLPQAGCSKVDSR